MNIEGHDDVVNAFRQGLQRQRLAHAYLFVGPAGIGKRLFARTLAQTLLCEDRPASEFDPCGRCPGCRQVQADSHPDLITLGRSSDEHDLPIETIRRAIHDLGFKPSRGRYKIAIVDDADDMNQYAANCFLKCLEEPPPRSLLILIGTSPDLQLPTIRSRCQVVRFQPLRRELVAEVLQRTGIVSDRAQAERLASLSGGSLERAQALADAELWEFRADLCKSLAAGPVDAVGLAERMNALIDQAGKESAEKRTRAKVLLSMAIEYLDASLRVRAGDATGHTNLLDRAGIDSSAACHSLETIANLIERTLQADYEIDRKASLPLVIDAWADELARCHP